MRWKQGLLRLGAVIGVGYVALILLLVAYQGRLIFLPPENVPVASPADLGLGFEDLQIPVREGGSIHAWWIPSADAQARTILFFHGNGGVLEGEVRSLLPALRPTGANLLLVDYRGYGHSSSLHPSGATVAEDAAAAMQYLEKARQVAAKDVVIFGYSIGTGVATQLALDEPGAGGLILLSPITSVDDVADEDWIYGDLLRPVQWFRHDNDLANKEKIGWIHTPLLILCGTEDTIARPWMAKELYARANEPKRIVWIEGAGHNDVMLPRDGTFLWAIVGFLDSLPKGRG
jgi:pimeloyl-ACP methyl ester carboxylesterase